MNEKKKETEDIDSLTLGELASRYRQLQTLLDQYRDRQDRTSIQVSKILSSIPLGLAVVDSQGTIEATNVQLRELFEYEAAELFGKPLSLLFPDLGELKVESSARKLSGRIKSGEMFFAEVSINEIDSQDGRRFCVHVKDVSEKQRMLEYKMNLASMVSHDLRSPLTTMGAVLTSIEDGTYGRLSDDGIQAVKWALVSSSYMNSVLANILDAERIDSAELTLASGKTSTGRIVDRALQLCKLYADELGIELESEVNDIVFYADEARLVRILVNLISNAVKFSPPSQSVRIESGLSGIKIFFRVIDRGPGIPEHLQSIIFDRFQHISKSGRDSKAGFGLGLSISRVFARLHDGEISVKSRTGQGTTFELTFPLRQGPDSG